MFPHLYDERKAADAAVYLLKQAAGAIHVPVLERLMYLAERESFRRHGLPLTGDSLVSFESGPGLWHTHQRLVGEVSDWHSWVSDLSNHRVGMRPARNLPGDGYFARHTALSEADIGILQSVWNRYGHLPSSRLIDVVQTECHEWDRSSPEPEISHNRLFRALGFTAAEIEGVLVQLEEIDSLNQLTSESAA